MNNEHQIPFERHDQKQTDSSFSGEKPHFSKSEMEYLVSDYAFGAISESDKKQFEDSLVFYPEVQADLEQIKAVFSSFDKEAFRESNNRRVRNLSVDVNKKLRKKGFVSHTGLVRRFAPLLAFAVLVIVVFIPNNFNSGIYSFFRSASPIEPLPSVVSDSEISMLVNENSDNESLLSMFEDVQPMTLGLLQNSLEISVTELTAASEIDDETINEIFDSSLYAYSDFSLSGAFFEGLTEQEIQSLLQKETDDENDYSI